MIWHSNSDYSFLRYSLRGDTKKYFSIGKYSGELKTVQALDREENSTYTMEVVAEDGRKRYFSPSSCCAFTVEGCQFMLFVWINMSIKLKLLYRASARKRGYQCKTSGKINIPQLSLFQNHQCCRDTWHFKTLWQALFSIKSHSKFWTTSTCCERNLRHCK